MNSTSTSAGRPQGINRLYECNTPDGQELLCKIYIVSDVKVYSLYRLLHSLAKSPLPQAILVLSENTKQLLSLKDTLSSLLSSKLTLSILERTNLFEINQSLIQHYVAELLPSQPDCGKLSYSYKSYSTSDELLRSSVIPPEDQVNRVGIVVHARMSSSRLPGKALLPILEVPVLEHILMRLSRHLPEYLTCLSTSSSPNDDYLSEYISSRGYNVFRGEEEHLSQRLVNVVDYYGLDIVVRVTGDDLFRDLNSIIKLVEYLASNPCDYVVSDDLILGCNSEVFTADALQFIHKYARHPHETSALTWYLDRPDIFSCVQLFHEVPQRPPVSLMLDTPNDFNSISKFCDLNKDLIQSNWSYSDLYELVLEHNNLFDYHPLDTGTLSRSSLRHAFVFDL